MQINAALNDGKLTVGDINNDSYPDVVTVDNSGSVVAYINNQQSEFVKKKKDIQKQRKQLEREKKMRTRPRPAKKEEAKEKEKPKKEEPKEVTSNDLKRQDNIDKLFERQEKRLAELKQDFKDEIFTKEEYLERIKSIEEQTNLALSKFGEGGKV